MNRNTQRNRKATMLVSLTVLLGSAVLPSYAAVVLPQLNFIAAPTAVEDVPLDGIMPTDQLPTDQKSLNFSGEANAHGSGGGAGKSFTGGVMPTDQKTLNFTNEASHGSGGGGGAGKGEDVMHGAGGGGGAGKGEALMHGSGGGAGKGEDLMHGSGGGAGAGAVGIWFETPNPERKAGSEMSLNFTNQQIGNVGGGAHSSLNFANTGGAANSSLNFANTGGSANSSLNFANVGAARSSLNFANVGGAANSSLNFTNQALNLGNIGGVVTPVNTGAGAGRGAANSSLNFTNVNAGASLNFTRGATPAAGAGNAAGGGSNMSLNFTRSGAPALNVNAIGAGRAMGK